MIQKRFTKTPKDKLNFGHMENWEGWGQQPTAEAACLEVDLSV